MKLPYIVQPQAKEDMLQIYAYIADSNLEAADRVAKAIDDTIDYLCENPMSGNKIEFDPENKMRSRTVLKFRNYIIFFRQEDNTLQILRVLHSARNHQTIFSEQE
jgi:toxin ParE1/3/4